MPPARGVAEGKPLNRFSVRATVLVSVLAAGCSTGAGDRQAGEIDWSDRDVVVHSSLGGSQIRSWRVVDSTTMIIDTYSHGELVATLMWPCPGLRFTEVVAFDTLGPFDLDRTSKVILPDGTVCQFKELKPFIQLEDNNE